jgi:hypothetical protein
MREYMHKFLQSSSHEIGLLEIVTPFSKKFASCNLYTVKRAQRSFVHSGIRVKECQDTSIQSYRCWKQP